jgi:hypothetical protein
MERRKVLICALAFGLVIGLGTTWIAEAQMQRLTLDMHSMNNSGITGTVTLTDLGSGKIQAEIRVNGAGAGPQPIHNHEGVCNDMNPEPKIPLADVRTGGSMTDLSVALQDLISAPHAIYMHKSPEELPVFIACADVLDIVMASQAPAEARPGHTGSGSLVGIAAGLAAFSLVLATAGRGLRRGA